MYKYPALRLCFSHVTEDRDKTKECLRRWRMGADVQFAYDFHEIGELNYGGHKFAGT